MSSPLAILGSVATILLVTALSTPAGVGGGLLFTPLMQIILSIQSGHAVALSQLLVSGASITAVAFQVVSFKRATASSSEQGLSAPASPFDFQSIRFMLPAIIAGSVLGVLLSKSLPLFVQPIALFGLCVYSARSILTKARITYQGESQSHVQQPSLIGNSIEGELNKAELETTTVTPPSSTLGPNDLRETLQFALVIFTLDIVLLVIRGSNGYDSIFGWSICSAGYWLSLLVQFTTFIAISLSCGGSFETVARIVSLGSLATLSGIGGGIVISPLLVERGLSPVTTTGSSILIVSCMSSAAAIDFLVSGFLPWWQVSLIVFSGLGSYFGMHVVSRLVRKSGRPSILLFLLGGLIVVGGLATLAVGLKNLARLGSGVFGVSSPCGRVS